MANHLVRPATLTGARVRHRAPHVEDADATFDGLASDPEVTRYLSWIPHRGVDETRRVVTKLFNVGDDPTWLIETRDTGEFVGTCGWIRPTPHTARWNLGIAWVAGGGGRESCRRWSRC